MMSVIDQLLAANNNVGETRFEATAREAALAPRTPPSAQHFPQEPHSWPSGRQELRRALADGFWADDGAPIGKGFGQPYLEYEYAVAVGNGTKPAEGRPGGGWLVTKLGREIEPNDYISFKIPRHRGRKLIVRVRKVRKYDDFKGMLEDVGVQNMLPGHIGDIDSAVEVYNKFGTTRGVYGDLVKEHGAVALDIEPLRMPQNTVKPDNIAAEEEPYELATVPSPEFLSNRREYIPGVNVPFFSDGLGAQAVYAKNQYDGDNLDAYENDDSDA